MPAKKRKKPIYQRGKFKLLSREGRNLDIVWYDATAKRERSISAGTTHHGDGRLALDRHYLESEGRPVCPTCHRPWDGEAPALVLVAITDYLVTSKGKAGYKSAKTRLSHIFKYLQATNADTNCAQVDEKWIGKFRDWRLKQSPKPSLAHIEGSVMQLAAAINSTQKIPAGFKAQQFTSLSQSPVHRSDIKELATMFSYAMEYDLRDNLLRFLRASVATWARPDAVHDIHSDNWKSNARVLSLNAADRRQTKKYRPNIPIARQFAGIMDDLDGKYISCSSIRHSWDKMRDELGLPKDREAGPKLIRRSIATIARKRLGEAEWIQGRTMLGHVKSSTSDIYALPSPTLLGRALEVTESIIEDIELDCPNAFYRKFTAKKFDFSVKKGHK